MSFIDIEITGLAELQRSFNRLSRLTAEEFGLVQALTVAAEGIMRDSRPLVPTDWGILKGSALVELPKISQDDVEVGMGYGGAARAYARAVHENPRSGKTGGFSPSAPRSGLKSRRILGPRKYKHYATTGEWKFLEKPFLAARQRVLDAISAEVHQRIFDKF